MGQNSTEVAYGFGQLGSAYSSDDARQIAAPEGKVIVAIQFLASNTPIEMTPDTSHNAYYPGFDTAAHGGTVNDVAAEGTASISAGTAITMTTNYSTKGYAVGWYVYGLGVPHGTKVSAVDVGSDEKEIKLDKDIDHTVSSVFSFVNPNSVRDIGGGGEAFGDAVFPGGLTIYGRWRSVTPQTDANGGIICYFGD